MDCSKQVTCDLSCLSHCHDTECVTFPFPGLCGRLTSPSGASGRSVCSRTAPSIGLPAERLARTEVKEAAARQQDGPRGKVRPRQVLPHRLLQVNGAGCVLAVVGL